MTLLTRHVSAVLDQGLYSTSNFVLNVALARGLAESDYGAFGTTYALFLLLTLIQSALLAEPMLVFASQQYGDRVFPYYREVRRLHSALSLILLLPLLLAYMALRVLGQQALADGVLGVGISFWPVLLLLLSRRLCYVIDRVGLAAASGAAYLSCLLVTMYALFRLGHLSILYAYGATSVSALLATFFLHALVRPRRSLNDLQIAPRQVLAEHYRYGRWSLGAGILIWIPANIYYAILPRSAGLQASGAFKAMMNFAMPMVQSNMALANVLLPALARVAGQSDFRRHLRVFTGWVAAGSVAYWLVVGALGKPLVGFLYGGRYLEYSGLTWYAALVPLVSWLALAERTAFKAIVRPDAVFRGTAVGAAVAGSLGLALTLQYGIRGALISMILSYGAMYLWLRRDPLRPGSRRRSP